ncbi:MAG: ACT domain-containing protein [Acidithiobacillales bacterium]
MAQRPEPLVLSLLRGLWAVCRLHPESAVPAWAEGGVFFSATRSPEELSIVCEDAAVPEAVKAEKGWALLKLDGPVPFDAIGVLSALTAPLAEAGIPVFAISTFDTDYLLVKVDRFGDAAAVLRKAGIEVRGKPEGNSSP